MPRWGLILIGILSSEISLGDEVTVLDDQQQRVTIDARWVGEGNEAVALERRDGRWEVVPQKQIIQRVPLEMPPPFTLEEMAQRLTQEFDASRTITKIEDPFVIVLISNSPLASNKKAVRQWDKQLRSAMRFLQGMQKGFLNYAKDAELEVTAPPFPLVVLIFENDREFNQYLIAQTEGRGLSAEKIASFYDLLTNRLALRLRECTTFTTPLHEAIHQQAHNRGVLTRLAPVPAWFNEGMATGFEGDGERVKSGPKSLNRTMAARAMNAQTTSWTDIVREDRAFHGDDLAGEAYAQAWALHWWLYTRHRRAYRQLLQHYSALTPLATLSAEERQKTFVEIVGEPPDALQQAFQKEMTKLLRNP